MAACFFLPWSFSLSRWVPTRGFNGSSWRFDGLHGLSLLRRLCGVSTRGLHFRVSVPRQRNALALRGGWAPLRFPERYELTGAAITTADSGGWLSFCHYRPSELGSSRSQEGTV